MKSVSMGIDIVYLLDYLQDELKDIEDVRVSAVAPSTTTKAPDLPQDYDPESNDLHIQRGVRVRIGSRDFFFPANWVNDSRLDLVQAQIKDIRDMIS